MNARIRHAEAYPFDPPPHSYLFDGGNVRPHSDASFDGRVPIIAYGSNAAPAQLTRKFPGPGVQIPVSRARLENFAVVYSSHFARYGSMPATLHRLAGGSIDLFVTWLTSKQLAVMHASEGADDPDGNYVCRQLDGLDLEVDDHGRIASATAYISRAGACLIDGRIVALSAIVQKAPGLDSLDQATVLRAMAERLAPQLTYAEFIDRVLDDAGYRRSLRTRLGETSIAFDS